MGGPPLGDVAPRTPHSASEQGLGEAPALGVSPWERVLHLLSSPWLLALPRTGSWPQLSHWLVNLAQFPVGLYGF